MFTMYSAIYSKRFKSHNEYRIKFSQKLFFHIKEKLLPFRYFRTFRISRK